MVPYDSSVFNIEEKKMEQRGQRRYSQRLKEIFLSITEAKAIAQKRRVWLIYVD